MSKCDIQPEFECQNMISNIRMRYSAQIRITKTCPCIKQQIFHGCEKDNFQMKNSDVFLIFAQNIDCGYTLEPPH